MEFDGTFRKVQFGGDFLIGKAAKNAVKDFFLTTGQFYAGLDALAGVEELLCFLGELAEVFWGCGNHDEVVVGGLTANHAMHSKQPGCVIDRKFPRRSRLNVKMSGPTCFLVKKINAGCG